MSLDSTAMVMECIRSRRSIRRFRSEPVGRKIIELALEAASWAPSAGSRQDWFFSVVTTSDLIERLADCVRQKWRDIVEANSDIGMIDEVERYASCFADFEKAPVVVVVSAERASSIQKRLLGELAGSTTGSYASAAMAAQNLMLAAHSLGLASCCMTGPLAAEEEIRQILALGSRRELVCIIALGYPDELPAPIDRKAMEDTVRIF